MTEEKPDEHVRGVEATDTGVGLRGLSSRSVQEILGDVLKQLGPITTFKDALAELKRRQAQTPKNQ